MEFNGSMLSQEEVIQLVLNEVGKFVMCVVVECFDMDGIVIIYKGQCFLSKG